mmetsp:Transcript_9576/g.28935  ORF Transcript_9576/g.28935 Transcript_9576/m.28935 type:complete len:231 (-) Transcript_9576:95-787(-)
MLIPPCDQNSRPSLSNHRLLLPCRAAARGSPVTKSLRRFMRPPQMRVILPSNAPCGPEPLLEWLNQMHLRALVHSGSHVMPRSKRLPTGLNCFLLSTRRDPTRNLTTVTSPATCATYSVPSGAIVMLVGLRMSGSTHVLKSMSASLSSLTGCDSSAPGGPFADGSISSTLNDSTSNLSGRASTGRCPLLQAMPAKVLVPTAKSVAARSKLNMASLTLATDMGMRKPSSRR